MEEIKVCIFDDSRQIRQAISLLLQTTPGIALSGAYANVLQAVELLKANPTDVVLMDIDMPGLDGLQGLAEIRKSFPTLPVVMLTVFDDEDRIFKALRSGASGYLLKKTAPPEIINAIRQVQMGGAPMTPSIAKKVLGYFQSPVMHAQPDQYQLTKREKEVLSHLVQGLSYKEIAATLFIGFETVRSHIKHIYEKLHVSSSTEAVAKAIREKLLD